MKNVKTDTVIASEYPFAIAAVMSGIKKQSKIYSWEHHHFDWLKKSFFWKFLFNSFYPKLNGIICLNKTEPFEFNLIIRATKPRSGRRVRIRRIETEISKILLETK